MSNIVQTVQEFLEASVEETVQPTLLAPDVGVTFEYRPQSPWDRYRVTAWFRERTILPRFEGKRTLFVTGERAEESASRAKYEVFEPHRADLRDGKKAKRHVDQLRPVHSWPEARIWEIMQRHGINPHPAYRIGFGRVSCMKCIFGSPDQFATVRAIDAQGFESFAAHETRSGKTIKRKLTIVEVADKGRPYDADPADVRAAMSESFDEPAILPQDSWKLPRGAFGDSCGPT